MGRPDSMSRAAANVVSGVERKPHSTHKAEAPYSIHSRVIEPGDLVRNYGPRALSRSVLHIRPSDSSRRATPASAGSAPLPGCERTKTLSTDDNQPAMNPERHEAHLLVRGLERMDRRDLARMRARAELTARDEWLVDTIETRNETRELPIQTFGRTLLPCLRPRAGSSTRRRSKRSS